MGFIVPGKDALYSSVSFVNVTSVNVVHNYGSYPVVQVLDNLNGVIIPLGILNNSVNDFTVTFTGLTSGTIISTLGASVPGLDGISAYAVAVADGFVGNEAAWLASLIGVQGVQGDPGLDGLGVPVGGTTGQILAKIDNTNNNTEWIISPKIKRVTFEVSSATPTINTDNSDIHKLTAQNVTITSFTDNLSGTPIDGQGLMIQITGTGAISITWGLSFEASTIALPTTTSGTDRLDVGFLWNVTTGKWRCIGVA